MAQCWGEISPWMKNSCLYLNLTNIEGMLVVRRKHLEEFAAVVQSPWTEDAHPQLVSSVCNLGVLLGSLLMLSFHIAASTCCPFYHLCLARRLHLTLVDEDLSSLIHALVTSPLDYSNAVYMGMKPSAPRKLQLVQILLRLLSNSDYGGHITPVLCLLRWLPIEYRITFKVLALIFKMLCDLGPGYLPHGPKLRDEDSAPQLCYSGTMKLSQ